MKPLAIDLFCGLGGWAEGFLAEGWDVVGFDIERHEYGEHKYPGWLVLQDVLTLHGSQFKGKAEVIVASPPCQKYSYMAMPWTRAKKLAAWYEEDPERVTELNALFNACFRIAREAELPLIVENVCGAQRWVGRAGWHFGSFYLWGDLPALMPMTRKAKVGGLDWSKFGQPDYRSSGAAGRWDEREVQRLCDATKNNGGSWFNVAHNTTSGKSQNPDGRKNPAGTVWRENGCNEENRIVPSSIKCGGGWFGVGNDCSLMRQHSSKSNKRKEASAQIAKIPFPLASHIARCFYPVTNGTRGAA